MISRKNFYEMLIDEWCDGERSVLISTHQVEEVEALAVRRDHAGRGPGGAVDQPEDIDQRFVALNHDPAVADAMAAAHLLLRYRDQGRTTSLFDGTPPEHLTGLGQRVRPSLVDLFVALTRNPP